MASVIKALAPRCCSAALGTLPSVNERKFVLIESCGYNRIYGCKYCELGFIVNKEFMAHPRDSASPQEQLENKLKATLLNFCYRLYLEGKSDEEVIEAVRKKDLPRLDRQSWWNLKLWFRQRELAAPKAMANIRRKIGK